MLIGALCAVLLAALVVQARRLGVTVDEPSHLISACLYWQGRDNLHPHDMPPLMKLLGGWAPRMTGLPMPPDLGHQGDQRHEWDAAIATMERMRAAEIERVFFLARLPMLVFPLLLVLLVWRWGRQLFGPAVGVLLAVVCAAEPTALGHGALFKNDIAATFAYALFWFMAWKYWRDPHPWRAAALGGATLLAMSAKLSMLFLAGAGPLVILLAARRAGWRRTAAGLALALLIPYLGLVALYQFETRRIPVFELQAYARNPHLPRWFTLAGWIFYLLPVPWHLWEGCVTLFENNAYPGAIYLLGRVYPHGTPLYFPLALAVKIPAPLQFLLLAGSAALVVSAVRRRLSAADLFWIVPGFLYIGLASTSALQLGVRLVLPALPFGILLCGAGIAYLWSGWRRALPVSLAAWLMVQSAVVYPHGISFMNLWSGGSDEALKYLADSNVDWGQSLPELREFVSEEHIGKFRLSYFGNDNVFRYFGENEVELVAPPWDDKLALGRRLTPKPGYYAISASLLPGHFFAPKYRDYYAAFREIQPVARAGDSIYIYRIGL